ncbi:MAG: hypothetical protein A4E53_00948 [Pelotomaculum sp. PtaB.Bin104]|nr:MAG: hypothetical protein A4E53_00948 [Pelotomaculum sp. PtaB.Bin104]
MRKTKKSCPCGSGKPYDQCCGRGETCCSLEQVRWRRAGQSLRRKLGGFADQPSFAWDAARAQDMYLGCMDQQVISQDDEFTMERCFEWFIFDYYLSSGISVVETFRDEYPDPLNSYEKTLSEEWAASRISLYEVREVVAADALIVEDLLRCRELKVHDVNAASELKEGSILLMRVLQVGEEYEFSTSGLALPNWCKEPLLKRLNQDRRHYYNEKLTGERGWGPYLKERAHKINAWVMEYGTVGARQGNYCTGRGKKPAGLLYTTVTSEKVLAQLKQSEHFELLLEQRDSEGYLLQAEAAWLGLAQRKAGAPAARAGQAQPEGVGKSRLRLVLGSLLLTPGTVSLTVQSSGLLPAGRKLITEELAVSKEILEEDVLPPDPPEFTVKNYQWPEPGYARVASSVQEGLEALGYNDRQQQGAVALWFDYCTKERPAIRKLAVWSAAVVYAFARLEMAEGLNQQDLAGHYGVASSTISSKFRLICRSLELSVFDQRYSTKKPSKNDRGEYKRLL